MRYPIWEKDDFFLVGGKRIDMDPLVVELPMTAPVSFQFNWDRPPYGEMTDIICEDGLITGELRIFEAQGGFTQNAVEIERLLKEYCRLGGYYRDVQYTDEAKTRVSSCSLRGVSICIRADVAGFPLLKAES